MLSNMVLETICNCKQIIEDKEKVQLKKIKKDEIDP